MLDERAQDFVRSVKDDDALFEHERVPFPSYPYEWPAEMLAAAGLLTLELAEAVLEDGFGLKDATPYNILFRGPHPVLVDVLSFERREQGDPTWLPYAQYVRMFLLPLLMHKKFGLRADQMLLVYGSGVEPENLYELCSWGHRLHPVFLGTVTLPTWLNKQAESNSDRLYRTPKGVDSDKAQYILRTHFRRLKKLLSRVSPNVNQISSWSSYRKTSTYSEEEFGAKADIVNDWLKLTKPGSVLDIGCNTGFFSELAAKAGAHVIAIDTDPVVVGKTWQLAAGKSLNILPLVVDLARPTPAMGWCNAESRSFLDRATGSFDLVLMLAILHHLLVTERIPLPEIVRLAARLSTHYLVIEYVSKEDPMFRKLTRGREILHQDYTREYFEAVCQERFSIIKKQQVQGDLRCLYLLERR
jgi:SAM-dependent methyltransferase